MWIQDAKNASVLSVGQALGLMRGGGRSLQPCPSCESSTRGSNDKKRGPIGTNAEENAWKCHRCGMKGDVVDLASCCLYQHPLRDLDREQQAVVRSWFADKGFCPKSPTHSDDLEKADTPSGPEAVVESTPSRPEGEGPSRPPIDDLKALWGATTLFEAGVEDEPAFSEDLNNWLILRRFSPILIDQSGVARIAPPASRHQYPKWWPSKWAKTYRMVTPVYESTGKFASIHARSVVESSRESPKTRWPYGFEARGLFMANGPGLEMMRGQSKSKPDGLLICEGFTDFLRASTQAITEKMNLAIIAGASGSFRVVGKINIPKSTKVFIATDPDEQGDEYAAIICDQLTDYEVYRVPLGAENN